MIGGVITSAILELLIYPVTYGYGENARWLIIPGDIRSSLAYEPVPARLYRVEEEAPSPEGGSTSHILNRSSSRYSMLKNHGSQYQYRTG